MEILDTLSNGEVSFNLSNLDFVFPHTHSHYYVYNMSLPVYIPPFIRSLYGRGASKYNYKINPVYFQ